MKIVIGIAALFILIGCSAEIERKPEPEGLIPKDKMVVVVREMVKLESFVQAKYVQVSTYHKAMVNSGDSLLLANKVTREQYEASIDYYGSRQTDLQEIYTEALEDLNQELSKLEMERNK
tara:strand:+ start:6820 stop:7179 length:360 start_codon:yes stop_codon:yes gene_type:complete